jgi:hypothetical protein
LTPFGCCNTVVTKRVTANIYAEKESGSKIKPYKRLLMVVSSYNRPGICISKDDNTAIEKEVRDLQKDLRKLGYLKNGIDGKFGIGTEFAVKALQHDILYNAGKSCANDGHAPVRMIDYNKERIHSVTGVVDEKLAECISEMINDPRFSLLPKADDPKTENSIVIATIKNMSLLSVPAPYLLAIFKQESGLKHYNEPQKKR